MYLLDTNVIIWLAMNPSRISKTAINCIVQKDALCFVSVISAWEYGQKRKLKPHDLPVAFETLIEEMPHEKLNFDFAVFGYAETLPLIHRDPFDRMLIAQTVHHNLTLVTSDKLITKYPVNTIW